MWSWAKSGWNSRAKDNRHDREQLNSSRRGQGEDRAASRTNLAADPGAATRRVAEKPQDLRLSRRGIARDRGGALSVPPARRRLHNRPARRANRRNPTCRTRPTTTCRSGKSRCRPRARKSSRQQRPPQQWEIRRLRLRRPRSRPPPRPTAQPAMLHVPAFPASLAASAAGQHAAATHSGAAAGTADCRERTGTG